MSDGAPSLDVVCRFTACAVGDVLVPTVVRRDAVFLLRLAVRDFSTVFGVGCSRGRSAVVDLPPVRAATLVVRLPRFARRRVVAALWLVAVADVAVSGDFPRVFCVALGWLPAVTGGAVLRDGDSCKERRGACLRPARPLGCPASCLPISATSTCVGAVVLLAGVGGLSASGRRGAEVAWAFLRRLIFFFARFGVLVLVFVMDRTSLSTVVVIAIGFPFDKFDG